MNVICTAMCICDLFNKPGYNPNIQPFPSIVKLNSALKPELFAHITTLVAYKADIVLPDAKPV